MKDRRREMIPVDKIKVINSRTRDEAQFALNVQSIDAVGQIKDIRVNDKFLHKEGFYELICGEGRLIAQKRLGKTHIFAEVVTCTRKQAYVESLVENLARSRPGTMDFARELKRLARRGLGLRADRHGRLPQRRIRPAVHPAGGERRRAADPRRGARRDSRSRSPIMVAQSDDANVQNVLMDAFDQGIVTSSNFARVRAIINARVDRRKRKGGARLSGEYTVATLTEDIASTTQSKESYVREAQGKESKLFGLLDGLATLWKDSDLVQLVQSEQLDKRPALTGTYNVTVV